MPLLKPERAPLPDSIKKILEDGINLFKRHPKNHKRRKPSKEMYADGWSQWETKLKNILTKNSDYIISIQVPFESVVNSVTEQLKQIRKGDLKTVENQKEKTYNVRFAAVTLPPGDIVNLLDQLGETDSRVKTFFKDKDIQNNLKEFHITLAHIKSHGLDTVQSYKIHLHRKFSVRLSALLFSDETAALEARLEKVNGEEEEELESRLVEVNGEELECKNEWAHVTVWTKFGVFPKEAILLPKLVERGKAQWVKIDPPAGVTGVVEFF